MNCTRIKVSISPWIFVWFKVLIKKQLYSTCQKFKLQDSYLTMMNTKMLPFRWHVKCILAYTKSDSTYVKFNIRQNYAIRSEESVYL